MKFNSERNWTDLNSVEKKAMYIKQTRSNDTELLPIVYVLLDATFISHSTSYNPREQMIPAALFSLPV